MQDGWISGVHFIRVHTCQHGCLRPDTRQPPPLVSEAPAGLGGPGRGPLLPAAKAGTPHTDPPRGTTPGDNEPSTPPDGTCDTSDFYILTLLRTLLVKKNLMEKGQGANGDGGFDMSTHLGTAAGNGGEEEEEMQRGTV